VLRALFRAAQDAHADPAVKAIVVTGSGANFSAGFDINQFVQASGGGGIDNRINEAICAVLEAGPKPTVAAVAGVALGGGLEVAMGCNARVATPGARLGLPELQLGIIPGFGGTQRLPRLVGLQKGIEMMLTSAPIKSEAALKLGLVDAVVPQESLLQAAKQLALDIASGAAPRMMSLTRGDRLEPMGEALAIIDFARDQASKRARHLHHPQLCLDAIATGVTDGGAAGLKKEGECFAAAAALDTHKALVHIFFAIRGVKKVRGITDAGLTPRPMKTVAVLGGGLMGSGIATALALAGVNVILKEVNQQFLDVSIFGFVFVGWG
jgi:enoyl-CoA hydratase/3-hydroxyacyl-CoA dehydrogenase